MTVRRLTTRRSTAPVTQEADATSVGADAAPASPAEKTRPEVELYSDGACSGNPGPGGWAFILRDPRSGKEKEGSGGDPQTTNNRMELLSVIEGLRQLRAPSRVRLVSDSKYVVDGLASWLDGWKRRGWKKADKSPVLNRELWEELDRLRALHEVRPEWIKGHAGHTFNERCDRLAVQEIERMRSKR
jgi:ribonuclease HI